MTSHSAWATWIHDNTVVIMLLISLGFGLLIWMGNKLLAMYKQVAAMEKEEEDSNIDRLVNSIEKLVERIDELFAKHDGHGVRITALERDTKSHFTMCKERENTLKTIQSTQASSIRKYDRALLSCAAAGVTKRSTEPVPEDRIDRES